MSDSNKNILPILLVVLNYSIGFGCGVATNSLIHWTYNSEFHFLLKIVIYVVLLLLIATGVHLISLFESNFLKTERQNKLFSNGSFYPIYIIIAIFLLDPVTYIGYLLVCIAAILGAFQTFTIVNYRHMKKKHGIVDEPDSNEKDSGTSKDESKSSMPEMRAFFIASYESYIRKDYQSTIDFADYILQIQPNNTSALTMRANSLNNIEYFLDAIDDYKQIIKLNPDDGNIYGLLGFCYQSVGDIDKCRECLKLSAEKGETRYTSYYEMMNTMKEIFETMKKNGDNPANLKRRELVSNIERIQLNEKEEIEKLKKTIHKCMETDPKNEEYSMVLSIIKDREDFEVYLKRLFTR